MPVKEVANCYHAVNGRPTKDLSTMIGLVVLQHSLGLNNQQSVDDLRHDGHF
ncbi:MAG: hypothetical protein LBP92_10780 [Deltaproteobacteria bacterium]|nr:hypothetical protein [Deltaproteobacteria bacterium]